MVEPGATVFVVDDDISVREALEALLQTAGWHVQSFASAEAFLDSSPTPGPACLVLDVGLPDLDGLQLQSRLAEDRSDMPIIFITGLGDIPTTVRAMKAGAVEFLTKPFGDEILLEAVAQAVERSRAAAEEQAALRDLRERHASLTPREREVLRLIVSGLLNKQVGGELGISEITVKAHRGRVMEKMRAKSFAALVKMSERIGTGQDS